MAAVQLQVSVEDEALAGRLVDALLEARLAACGQVLGPIRSRYRWRGSLESAREWLVLVKTEDDRAEEAVARLRRLHPAETPEILVLAVQGGLADYLSWVRAETRPEEGRRSRLGAVAGRPTRAEQAAAAGRMVPDVLAPGLALVFCGINPGLWSAAVGHHFARPGNRFWRVLHEAGLTGELFGPEDERRLLEAGLGITNLVRRSSATAAELSPGELHAGAAELAATVERLAPRAVAVLGVGAYRTAFRAPRARLGEQPERLAGARVWVLPNPSGAQARYQLPELVELFGALRADLGLGDARRDASGQRALRPPGRPT